MYVYFCEIINQKTINQNIKDLYKFRQKYMIIEIILQYRYKINNI